MATFAGGYSSKPAWQLQLDVAESNLDALNNRSYVSWALYVYRGNGDTPYNNEGSPYSVNAPGGFSGTFGAFNYASIPVGGRYLMAQGGDWVTHSPDGSYSYLVSASHNSLTTLGYASLSGWFNLTTLRQPPGTPTSVSAARVSDTQAGLSWVNNYATNGPPQTNLIRRSLNNAGWEQILDIAASTSATISCGPNQKIKYSVQAWNPAGFSSWSAESNVIYTTPAAPTNASATKNSASNIVIAFNNNVAYSEHEHVILHGVVSGGSTTWDASPLVTLPSGTTSWTHVAPNSAQVHAYAVRSKAAGLESGWAYTNSVQLLAPPNKPTPSGLPTFANKAETLRFGWVHNPIDTTPQKFYETSLSTNGGSSWSTTGKVASTSQFFDLGANSFAANTTVLVRVRTWGSAATGGSDGTGASPWSDNNSVTFKTLPTVVVTSPADGSVVNDSTLRVNIAFSQAEGASFVKATLRLYKAGAVIETVVTNITTGITFNTPLENGVTYGVTAQVQDSNGLLSIWDSGINFSVTYLTPVPADVSVVYLPSTGYGQIDLAIPEPGAGQAAAAKVTITRKINGVEEYVVKDYPAAAALTFLDTTPTIHGINEYTITTTSAIGSQNSVTATLVTSECRRAFLSKGNGFSTVVVFGANLSVSESLSVASDTVEAAGRKKPIGLYGVETSVTLKVSSFIFLPFGSTLDQLRDFLLISGKACYRDSSGRRVFGAVKGSVAYQKTDRGDFQFTMTETS